MLTEDYIMRMINMALAVLMQVIGLKKAGRYREAGQAVDQAVEHLLGMRASLVKLMDDQAILEFLTTNGELDVDRLAVLADLFNEEGEILLEQGQVEASDLAFARALRFTLEIALSGKAGEPVEHTGKIMPLYQRLATRNLPVETRLALYDYFERLLRADPAALEQAGLSNERVGEILRALQRDLEGYV